MKVSISLHLLAAIDSQALLLFLMFSLPNGCVVVFHCSNLKFSNHKLC